MRRRLAAIGCTAGALLGGCGGTSKPPLAEGCTGDRALIAKALATAPGAVALPDGTPLSRCIADGTSDADLQNVGILFSGVADDLGARVREGDRAAAVQLGFLIGATRRGAQRTNGVMSELVRRIQLVGDRLTDETPPATVRDIERGQAAGQARG